MKFKILHRLFNITMIFSLLFVIPSCQKEISDPGNTINQPSTGDPFVIEGIVTGANNIPLRNVMISAGSVQVTTDENGSFRAENARFTTEETFVTASLSGYFTGSRTFFAKANSNNFLRIQLLQKVEVSTVSGSGGGPVNFSNVSLTFPANAFSAPDGTAYTGTISVKAVYLNPASRDISRQMPGDLRGKRTTGEIRGLQTFGMFALELESTNGTKLQLRPGIVAQLSMPVPASLSATAPSSVPLWYFDETTGLWKEEGVAQKTGNNYTGNVSHFTFWNVDVPYEYVKLGMTISNQSQQNISGAEVVLTSLADSSMSFDYTDQNGFVDGFVPKNVQLRRDVYNECGALVSSGLIGPFTADTDLGNVQVTSVTNQQTIFGTVTGCNNLPLTNGYVIISLTGNTVYATVTNGSFSSSFTSCTAIGGTASIIAVDGGSLQQSTPFAVTLTSAVVDAGALQTCGVQAEEFITVTVDGISRSWSPVIPYDLYGQEDSTLNSGFYNLNLGAYNNDNGGSVDIILFRSEDSVTAPFTVGIQSMSIYDQLAAPNMLGDYFVNNSIPQTPVSVLTTYGAVGEFIIGNFSGSFIKNDPSSVDTVDVTCSFKLRREP